MFGETLLESTETKVRKSLQYKSLKLDRNGEKSKKSKTIFVASPVEDLDGFYQGPFPE